MRGDIGNFVADASFDIQVADGVWWVPLNSLGRTRYGNDEMAEIAKLPWRERKRHIGNLYEAVQLFQVSGFRGVFDNVDHQIGGAHWQTHKGREMAVQTNEGCCATDTHWLNYFIQHLYHWIGCFGWANRDGNGHVINCIRRGEAYYFLDMMMCRADSQPYGCREREPLSALLKAEWAGLLFRADSPENYARFTAERIAAKGRDVPFCFYMRDTAQATATGCSLRPGGGADFYVPLCDKPSVVWERGDANSTLTFVDLPEELKIYAR